MSSAAASISSVYLWGAGLYDLTLVLLHENRVQTLHNHLQSHTDARGLGQIIPTFRPLGSSSTPMKEDDTNRRAFLVASLQSSLGQ